MLITTVDTLEGKFVGINEFFVLHSSGWPVGSHLELFLKPNVERLQNIVCSRVILQQYFNKSSVYLLISRWDIFGIKSYVRGGERGGQVVKDDVDKIWGLS